MQLRLCVDIRSLKGDICAWLPPPPGDRLWYSFMSAPSLEFDVKPLVSPRCFSVDVRPVLAVELWDTLPVPALLYWTFHLPGCVSTLLFSFVWDERESGNLESGQSFLS